MMDWPWGLFMGVMTGVAIASILFALFAPEIRLRRETPELIKSCHAKGGTAKVEGRRNVYAGCLIPPGKEMLE